MTGVRPKSDFVQPGLLFDVSIELVRQILLQYVLRVQPLMPTEVGVELIKQQAAKKQPGTSFA